MPDLRPDTVIQDSLNHEERAVCALEAIADALTAWYKLEALRLEKEFPARPEPKDATVTRIPSADDKLRASQGATGEETTEEWIGLREEEFVKKSGAKS